MDHQVNIVFNAKVDNLDASLNKVEQGISKVSESSRKLMADMNYLGIGFFGMQIQQTFQGILTSGIETFLGLSAGTDLMSENLAALTANFNYFKFVVGSTLLEVFDPLIGKLANMLEWFNNLDSDTQKVIVTVMAATTAFGFMLMQIGFIVIGIQSLASAFGAAEGVGLTGAIGIATKGLIPFLAALAILYVLLDDNSKNTSKLRAEFGKDVPGEGLLKYVGSLGDLLSGIMNIFAEVIRGVQVLGIAFGYGIRVLMDYIVTFGETMSESWGNIWGSLKYIVIKAMSGVLDWFANKLQGLINILDALGIGTKKLQSVLNILKGMSEAITTIDMKTNTFTANFEKNLTDRLNTTRERAALTLYKIYGDYDKVATVLGGLGGFGENVTASTARGFVASAMGVNMQTATMTGNPLRDAAMNGNWMFPNQGNTNITTINVNGLNQSNESALTAALGGNAALARSYNTFLEDINKSVYGSNNVNTNR